MDDLNSDIIAVFLQSYEPAKDFSDMDENLTTGEILKKIKYFNPDGKINSETIIKKLKEAGFRYQFFMDQFRWLLKEKTK